MKLQQIRAFCVVADEAMSISRAARVLCMTQPAVSKQIKQLEDSLGATLLVRSKSRLLGLTDVGEDVLRSARAMLAAAQDIGLIVSDHQQRAQGRLVIATTHTHARYALQDIIPSFARRHPEIALNIVQANPSEISDLVLTGQADLVISTLPPALPPSVVAIACYTFKHVLIGPPGHAVFDGPITLETMAAYPLITYSEQHAIGRRLIQAFDDAGLAPKIAVRGTDVEVMKYYASIGLGLAVIPVIAYASDLDRNLTAAPIDHLFPTSTVYVVARRGAYWPRHQYDFVETVTPGLTRDKVDDAMSGALAGEG